MANVVIPQKQQRQRSAPKQGIFGQLAPVAGAVGGAVIGGLASGGTGALAGATAGASLGGLVGGVVDPQRQGSVAPVSPQPQGVQASSAMDRRLQVSQNPLRDLEEAQLALQTQPLEIQQEFGPALGQALSQAQRQQKGSIV